MLIGHKKIIKDLSTFVKNETLGHGYIFFGPGMVGKRMVAQALANFLETGTFETPNDHVLLQDAKTIDIAYMKSLDPDTKDSIGIDAVREIKNFLWQKPNASTRRVLIIDGVEFLTTEAQNALLKITEEPPASSLLILITSDIESVMPTILSRLPKVYFGAIEKPAIAEWLIKEEGMTKAKAEALAEQAMGKPGLAWRLLHDEPFKENLETAKKFIKTPAASRKEFIKKILEPEDFNLRIFLEAVIVNLAWEKPSKAKAAFWHKALKLYENANNFGLNPRLQLENLLR